MAKRQTMQTHNLGSSNGESQVSIPVPSFQAMDSGLRQSFARLSGDAVGIASRILFGTNWVDTHYDAHLRRSVQAILDVIGGVGFFASLRDDKVQLVCPGVALHLDDVRIDESIMRTEGMRIVAGLRRERRIDPYHDTAVEKSVTQLRAVVVPVRGERASGCEPAESLVGVLFYNLKLAMSALWDCDIEGVRPEMLDHITDEYLTHIGSTLTPMLVSAFRHREGRFSAFAPHSSMRYWIDAAPLMDQTATPHERMGLRIPPWDRTGVNSLVETATLSLDLRKSTYCMEFAKSEVAFGKWLHHLVVKMREVAHLHSGVFDKFTGDGALIHFLQSDVDDTPDGVRRQAVDAALECAVDLQRAIEIHMKTLRRFLKHDSPLFGAGIAIDVGQARWSSMRGNPAPIVVGKGVVGACRVGDKAPRLSVRLTNLAYHELSDTFRKRLDNVYRVSLETKENPGSFPLECWEFRVEQELNLGRGLDAIYKLCEEIGKRFPDI